MNMRKSLLALCALVSMQVTSQQSLQAESYKEAAFYTAIASAILALKSVPEIKAVLALNQADPEAVKTSAKWMGIANAPWALAGTVGATTGLVTALKFKAKQNGNNSWDDDFATVGKHLSTGTILALLSSPAFCNLHRNHEKFKNRDKIAEYRKDPKVQEYLTKMKTKQLKHLIANYILMAAAAFMYTKKNISLATHDESSQAEKSIFDSKYLSLENVGIVTFIAACISEYYRSHQRYGLEMATAENPLVFPVEAPKPAASTDDEEED